MLNRLLSMTAVCCVTLSAGCVHDDAARGADQMVTPDGHALIAEVLPEARAYAAAHEAIILANGDPLSGQQIADARRVGVAHPENVRVLATDAIPMPNNVRLRQLMSEHGMTPGNLVGMTFGYGIYVLEPSVGNRHLLMHELAHVAQYERLGGIEPFTREYMAQLLTFGYGDAPLEREARQKARQLH